MCICIYMYMSMWPSDNKAMGYCADRTLLDVAPAATAHAERMLVHAHLRLVEV